NLHASQEPCRMKTVVIDPGHGGKDPGCMRNGIMEKNIVLSVALKLGKMIQDSLPDLKVIYTRSSDKFVSLQDRAALANRNHADLFISIHVNATKSSQPRGSETFCMGLNMSADNMEVCQQENSVITLEDDYTSKYEGFDPKSPESYIIFSLLQNSNLEQSLKFAENVQNLQTSGPIKYNRGVKQAGFVVLWKCSSPAILTELGFLTNDSDYRILSDSRRHRSLAHNLFKAVKLYKNSLEHSDNAPEANTGNILKKKPSSPQYTIQVLSSKKHMETDDPQLKGLDCYVLKIGDLNKYVTGRYFSKDEAQKDLPRIRKKFKDAFVIPIPD
ncbi:MAG: N-acetylmuramoyl-L-alanine amidase, partial [Alistipes sp.]|nr:N-acetylmuramoyl-L-alanine amidase [Candidatus Minthomonas equi]